MNNQVDYIIVGFGITGACFAHYARSKGKSVLVFDLADQNTSSSVAIGLFHPMSFKKTVLAWSGMEYFQKALDFYSFHAEEHLRKLTLNRILNDTEEYNRWNERMGNEPFSEILEVSKSVEQIKAPFGVGQLKACAKLDVQEYIAQSRNTLLSEGSFYESKFDYHSVDLDSNSIKINEQKIDFKQIIFCEGLGAKDNPWFDLKFQAAKGDVLKISSSEVIDKVINKRHFITPIQGNEAWLGATYDWRNTSNEKDLDAAEELLETARNFLADNIEFELKEHLTGVRPASFDRRPFVGAHEDFPSLACLNGMGSRAVLLSPMCSEFLFNHLEHGHEIPKELSLKRLEKFRNN